MLKSVEVDSRVIKFYLEKLRPNAAFCLDYLLEQQTRIVNAKLGLVKFYDYYKPHIEIDQKYKIRPKRNPSGCYSGRGWGVK